MIEVPNSNRRRLRKNLKRYWILYVFLLPAVIYLLIFAYQPMYGVIIAFKEFHAGKGILGSPWIGLVHFERFINYPFFSQLLKNTVILSLYSLLAFPVPVIFALSLNEMRNVMFKKTVQMITYAPNFISTVIICGMIILFFNRSSGLVNNFLELLGMTRVDFMGGSQYFRHIYVWSGVWQSFGFSSVIYLAGLSNVSEELEEAARIDGASRLKIIWHIHLPTIAPTVILLLILSTGGILSTDFTKVLLLQNQLNTTVSEVISTYTYKIGIRSGIFDYAAAIGLFNTLVSVSTLLFVNWIAKRTTEVSLW